MSQSVRWGVHPVLVLDVGLCECDVLVGHLEGGVAEDLLQRELVAARAEELNREGVAEGVRRTAHGLESGGNAQTLDKLQ